MGMNMCNVRFDFKSISLLDFHKSGYLRTQTVSNLLGYVWLDGIIDGKEWSFHWTNHSSVWLVQK